MIREAAVALALAHLAPRMPPAQRAELAHTFHIVAEKRGLDPLDLVAIAWHESDLRAGAISPDGEDFGLMQVRGRFLAACLDDRNSKMCKIAKVALLDPHRNIEVAGAAIAAIRSTLCRRTGHKATFPRWLQAYGGLNHPRAPGVWCGQRKVKARWVDVSARQHRALREILDCRRNLTLKRRCTRELQSRPARSRSTRQASTSG